MENLKGKFGRRMVAVCGAFVAVIAVAVALSVSTIAKAEPNEITFYQLNESYLSCNVQAPRNATFDDTYTFTFTANASESAGTSTLSIPAQTANVTATDGVLSTTTSDFTIDPTNSHGRPLVAPTTEATVARTAADYDITDTTYSYIVTRQLSTFIALGGTAAEIRAQFPNDGVYTWDVVVSEHAKSGDAVHYTASKAQYKMQMVIVAADGGAQLNGLIFNQVKEDSDGNTVYVPKKNPKLNWGLSNYEYKVPSYQDQPEAQWTETVWEGFTFVNWFNYEPVNEDQPFYLQKIVSGNYAPSTAADFTISNFVFHNDTWTATTTPVVVGAYQTNTGTAEAPVWADDNTRAAVTFTMGAETATATNVVIKDKLRIIFDGNTHTILGGSVTTTKLPVGTYYEYTEVVPADSYVNPSAVTTTWKASAAVDTTTTGTLNTNLVVSYLNTAGTAIENQSAIIGVPAANEYNKSVITNKYDVDPTNLWIDFLPYVLMIGLPIVAFVIWILQRRRKLNK